MPVVDLSRSIARHQNVPSLALSYGRPEPQRRRRQRLHIPFRNTSQLHRDEQSGTSDHGLSEATDKRADITFVCS